MMKTYFDYVLLCTQNKMETSFYQFLLLMSNLMLADTAQEHVWKYTSFGCWDTH